MPPRFALGWRKEPADTRDKPFAMFGLGPGLPDEATLRPFVTQVVDQLDTQSCVANAVAQAVHVSLAYRDLPSDLPSRLFLYFNSRAFNGEQRADNGTYVRSCVKGLSVFGAPTEAIWPFDPTQVNYQPEWNAYRMAFDFRGLRGYFRIFDDDDVLTQVRAAIATGRPVVSGWRVEESILDPSGPDVIDVPTGSIIGGHAMAIIGYLADGTFELCNSWGTGWRDSGFVRCTSDFVLAGQDRWVVDTK